MLVKQHLSSFALSWVGPIEERTDLLRCEIPMILLFGLQCRLHETHLEDLEAKHFVLYQTAHYQPVDAHLLLLSYSEGSVDGLRISRRVPRRIHDHNSVCSREVETHATNVRRQEHHLEAIPLLLELLDFLSPRDRVSLSVNSETPEAVEPQTADLDQVKHLDALREHQCPMTSGSQLGQQHCETLELCTLLEHGLGSARQPPQHHLCSSTSTCVISFPRAAAW
mmetsp:Transcript_57639/g.153528  ORF Transcript_57639/g.153528 Transcript_57639/m.153528 type:complete len:224 (-) Transcript_57639:2031-2702(-)